MAQISIIGLSEVFSFPVRAEEDDADIDEVGCSWILFLLFLWAISYLNMREKNSNHKKLAFIWKNTLLDAKS